MAFMVDSEQLQMKRCEVSLVAPMLELLIS